MSPTLPSRIRSARNVRRLIRVGLGVAVTVALSFSMVPAAELSAESSDASVTVDGLTYDLPSNPADGATVTGYQGTLPDALTIPDTVTVSGTTYKVTIIGTAAFDDEAVGYKGPLTLGKNVTTVGDDAFLSGFIGRYAPFVLPASVTTIGVKAFANNWIGNTAPFSIPDAVTTIGNSAFASIRFGKEGPLTIGDSVAEIGADAFVTNPDMKAVIFTGAAPTTIRERADPGATFNSDPVLSFTCKYASPSYANHFTAPTWEGYTTSTTGSFTVTYDVGGYGTAPADQTLGCGTTPTVPDDPTAAGWVFTGWHTGSATGPVYDFDTITGDVSVYASWVAPAVINGGEDTTASGVSGQLVSWIPSSLSGSPAPTVTATGLPDGLKIDPATGVISGTPTVPGVFPVMVTADNGVGEPSVITVTLTVVAVTFTVSTDKNVYHPGDSITVTGVGGLPPGAAVHLVLHSLPMSLGTAAAGADGGFVFHGEVPADAQSGAHDVVATADFSGASVTAKAAVQVLAAAGPLPAAGQSVPPQDEPTAVLAATGAPAGMEGLLAIAMLFVLGGTVLLFRRRRA